MAAGLSGPAERGPPRLAVWLLQRGLPGETADGMIGDLHELYHAEVAAKGVAAARRWYWREAFRALTRLTAVDFTGPLPAEGAVRQGAPLSGLSADVRHALRQMRRAPLFTAVALMLLAAGISVSASLIAMVDSLIAAPLPGVADGRALVAVDLLRTTARGTVATPMQPSEIAELGGLPAPLASITTASFPMREPVDVDGVVGVAYGVHAGEGYFDLLGVDMVRGRAPRGPVETGAVIAERWWREVLHGDPAVIGRSIRIRGVTIPVVGVAPERFAGKLTGRHGNTPVDLWLSPGIAGLVHPEWSAGPPVSTTVARLRDGGTIAQATAALERLAPTLRSGTLPARGVRLEPLAASMGALLVETIVLGDLAIVVLLIAGANVSILLLGRAVLRRREIAVRLALGAGRGRIIRQLLVESTVLALVASAGGLLLARLILEFISAEFPAIGGHLALTWRSIAVTTGVAGGAGCLFGLLPALHGTRVGAGQALKAGVGGGNRMRTRLQRSFVVAEVALSIALVATAGMLASSMSRAGGIAGGSDAMTAEFAFGLTDLDVAGVERVMADVGAALRGLDGVRAVSWTSALPGEASPGPVMLVGATPASGQMPHPGLVQVEPEHFAASGVPLLAGRDFTPSDRAGAPRVVVIDARIATLLGHTATAAVGREIELARYGVGPGRADTLIKRFRIAGVAAASGGPRAAGTLYFPRQQGVGGSGPGFPASLYLLVSATTGTEQVAATIRAAVRSSAPALPVGPIETLAAHRRAAVREELAVGRGGAVAGAIALLMSAVGLWAVVAFMVTQRRHEIGVRIALGARPAQVVRLFFGEGARLALLGGLLAVPLTLGALAAVRSDVSGVATEPGPIVAVALLIGVVTALASWLPARRAARVDPMQTVRSE